MRRDGGAIEPPTGKQEFAVLLVHVHVHVHLLYYSYMYMYIYMKALTLQHASGHTKHKCLFGTQYTVAPAARGRPDASVATRPDTQSVV